MGRAGQVADWVASHGHIAKPLGLVKELKRQGAPKSGGVRNVLRFGRPLKIEPDEFGYGRYGIAMGSTMGYQRAQKATREICEYLKLNMFAANPRFARGESRISFDMLKSLRRV